jgi:hypothetical protein
MEKTITSSKMDIRMFEVEGYSKEKTKIKKEVFG